MIVSNVESLLQMSDGSVPEAFKGILIKVYEHKPCGQGQQRSTMQRGTLGSTEGNKIEIVFYGRPPVPPSMIGKEIYCTAQKGTRGLSGLKRKDNDYNNKITPQVWVYDKAELACEDAQATGEEPQQQPPAQHQPSQQRPAPPAQQQRQQPAAQPAQQPTATSHAAGDPVPGVKTALHAITKLGNLLFLCQRWTDKQRAEYEATHGTDTFTVEVENSYRSTVYIQAVRDGVHHTLPASPINAKWMDEHLAPKK